MAQSALAEVDGGSVAIGASMWSIYQHGIDKDPQHTALVVTHQQPDYLESLVGPSTPPHHCLAWTYGQLRRGAARLAATLQAHEIEPGSTIAIMVTNSAEWALMTWAAAIGGYTLALLDPKAVDSARFDILKYFFKMLQPALVLVEDAHGFESVDRALQELSFSPKLRVCRGRLGTLPSQWTTMEQLADQDHGENIAPLKEDINRVATYLFTSGTSVGRPKGVPKTVENWLAFAQTSGMDPISSDTVSAVTTLSFRAVCNNIATTTWYNGATLVMPGPGFEGESFLQAVQEYQVTFIKCGYSQIYTIIESPSFTKEKVRSVKDIHIGGDVITTQLLTRWREYFPNAVVTNYWGMTEGCGVVGWPPGHIPETLPVFETVISIGRTAPGAKIRIVGESGDIVRRGEKGELHVGGPLASPGYLDGVQASNFYTDDQGRWMKSGDVATIDDDGNVFTLGRLKDIIKKKGAAIAPGSIESCIGERYNVFAQVVGIPGDRYGEELYAVLQTLPDQTSTDHICDTIEQVFGPEYALSGVVTLADLHLAGWPKGVYDKILKRDLREHILKLLAK